MKWISKWYKRMSLWRKIFLWLFVFIPVGSVVLSGLFFGGIALFEDTKEYITKSELDKLKEENTLAYVDTQNAEENKLLKAEVRKAYIVVFRGAKAGWYAVYIIMGVIGLIWLMSVYRKQKTYNKRLTGSTLGFYCTLLVAVAILEIWYLFSLGMKGAAWFIHDPSTVFIIVNGIMLIVFALGQMAAVDNALSDLSYEWDIEFDNKWKLWGILFSIALYVLSRFFHILSEERELLIVLCILLGQIPQAINMWRGAKYICEKTERKPTFVVFYLIAITGTICLTIYMLVALIVGLIAFVVMFLFSRGDGGGSRDGVDEVTLEDGTILTGDGNHYRSKDGGHWRKTVGGFEKW
jgi:hypothetical protein